MIKRRSNSSFFPRGGLLFILLLTAAMPGCKKKTPLPPPQVTPLPKKIEPTAAATSAKPVQKAPSSARMPAAGTPAQSAAQNPVQKQLSTSKRLAQPATMNLDFASRRDPFKPFAQMPAPQKPVAGKPTKGRVREPLPIQSFDTEKFKVSGIVTGLKENSALVIDPNGKGYVVREGLPIGSNGGYIKRITNSTIEVEESFRDDSGRVRKRLVKLTLIRKK